MTYLKSVILKPMSSNDSLGQSVLCTNLSSTAYYLFNNIIDTGSHSTGASVQNPFIGIKLTESKIVKIITLTASSYGFPKSFVFQGSNNGIEWIDIQNFHNISYVPVGQKTEFFIDNNTAYVYYRIYQTGSSNSYGSTSSSYGNRMEFIEIDMYELAYEKLILLQSNNKIYSLDSIDTWYETNMTSNTAPSPYVASASSSQSATFPAWKAFDGKISPVDTANSWSATTTLRNGWLQLDFGKKVTTNRISLTVLEYTTSPKDFQILGSDDASTWTTLLDIKDMNWQQYISNETKEFIFNKIADNRYYRMNITTVSSASKQPMVTELKYGLLIKEVSQLPSINKNNFINYGKTEFVTLGYIADTKNYILQDKVSENEEGLWTTKLDRKPLSISFN